MNWEGLREQFPALRGRAFLNTATFGQLPRCATEAVARHFAQRDETACADFLNWFADHDRLRGKLARLVGCEAEDIAYTPNAAAALATLMNGLEWREGDEVAAPAGEFPNNVYFPARLERRGVRFVEAGWPDLLSRITERTRLVVVSTVNYATGLRPPLAALRRRCDETGALLFVDGTQSVGALRFEWAEARPDWFAVHAYKWMLTPNGAAFCAAPAHMRARIAPQVVGWRSHKTWREVDHLHHGAPELVEAAEQYEGGGLASALLYALEAVTDLLEETGTAAIEERVLELAGEARARLRALGAALPYDEAPELYESPIVCARFAGRDASSLAKALRERGVIVSARLGYLRVSTHFYNDGSDLDRLSDGLRRVL